MKNKCFEKQHYHIIGLLGLCDLMYYFYSKNTEVFYGKLFGIDTLYWFMFSIAVPVLHQFYVLICWRLELYKQTLSRIFGKNKAFKWFKFGFAILILLRPVSVLFLAWSNKDSINLNRIFSYGLSIVFFILAAYLLYSVKRYFGLDRAFGKDHFFPEQFRNSKLITVGIFKYTPNAMYVFGFLMLWISGLIWQSGAALLAAFFNHSYIWVHYFFTENPDMKTIYVKDLNS